MNGYRLAMIALLVATGLTVASVGALAIDEASQAPSADDDNETKMGERIGTFMHSSTAEADGSIDRGMFEATYNESDDKEAAVRERIDALERTYEELDAQSAALESNSTLPDPARRAVMVRLAVQLDSFHTSIAETERHAQAVGVETDRLETLRTNASALAGPEVAEIAMGLAGVNVPGQTDGGPSAGEGDGSDDDDADRPDGTDDQN